MKAMHLILRHKLQTPRRPPPPPPAPTAVAPDQSPSPAAAGSVLHLLPLDRPPQKKPPSRSAKLLHRVRSVFRSFPVISPPCKMPVPDMGLGLVRIALECEKAHNERVRLADEPIWSMYCNGRKVGYAVRRDPTEDDLRVMQMLRAASMGAGVLPSAREGPEEGEMTYMRAYFERVVGSKDSETYYMMSPDGNGGPELSIFFVRV
ncbi:Protein of unknown function- DUF617 [Striga hermonthica]|uniref:Protein MIZU-KUSSEI 1 n=1 Tax=Striga hermonthica TaxID=68872 RepID=A0A9N7RP05_STRHE|nr:Protein of unknown function- DUF617 [Striga hermonthica]